MSVLMGKSILTTVVLVLAIAQAISGPRARGALRLPPLARRRLRPWHRWGGDITLILTLAIAAICVVHAPFRVYPLRVPLHAALGTLAAVAMLLKVIIARRFRGYLRYAWIVGAIAGFSILGCFVASALWYFGSLLQVANPPLIEVAPTQTVSPTAPGVETTAPRTHSPTATTVDATPAEQPSVTPPPAGATPSVVQTPTAPPIASGPQLLQERCTSCHGLDRVDHPHTQVQWEAVTDLMREYGAYLTDQEAQALVEYLAETYGP